MAPLSGRRQWRADVGTEDLGIIEDGAVVVEDGVIAAVGTYAQCAEALKRVAKRAGQRFADIDAERNLVLPGFVDAHTHALFGGNRVADFEAIAAGEPPPLGMRYTIEQTRKQTFEGLISIGTRHLQWMADHGTTTAEIKSGYALSAEGESLMLRVAAALNDEPHLPKVVPTFCGAHALPPEFCDYDAFVDELCEHVLPHVAALRIAQFADAFCELGFFSVNQSRRFLEACALHGLKLRLHADELTNSGGSQLAAELGCASADHLNFIDERGIEALAAAKTIAVLCPATAEHLGLARYAPARALIEAGVPVALATDFNPGTCPCLSLQTVAYLARRRLNMSAAETLAGITVWPAKSLGLAHHAGCLQAGRSAELLLLGIRDFRELGYYYGTNILRTVFITKNYQPVSEPPF